MKILLSSSSGVIAVINQINEAFSEYSTGDQPAPLIKDKELSYVITSWENAHIPTLPNTDLHYIKSLQRNLMHCLC